jgi:hypothetical protein
MTQAPTQFDVMHRAINNDNQLYNILIKEKEEKTIRTQVILRINTAEYWIRNCVGRTEVVVCTIWTNRMQNLQWSPNKSAVACARANLTDRQQGDKMMTLVAIVKILTEKLS